ncbi:MAG: hypothetical protein N2423_05395, partial [Novosphingobium sp.]|nr:hypothetical protein [Novosphingobium sp.]
VALWFGALFGLGSIAIRPSLIEKAVLAVDLHRLIPAAEPPLGATTQSLLALLMAIGGGLLGALLARRMGRPRARIAPRRRTAASSRQLSADEAANDAAMRRRPLAIERDQDPSESIGHAAFAGAGLQIFDVTEFDLEGFEAASPQSGSSPISDGEEVEASVRSDISGSGAPEAFQSAGFDHPPASIADDAEPFRHNKEQDEESLPPHAPEPVRYDVQTGREDKAAEESGRDGLSALWQITTLQQATFAASPEQGLDDEDEGSQQPGLQASPFKAPSYRPLFARPADDAGAATGNSSHDESADGADAAQENGRKTADLDVSCRILAARLSELSHVELLERLAISLERRRRREAQAADAMSPGDSEVSIDGPEPHSQGAEPESGEDFGRGFTQPPIPVIPAGLRPIDLEEEPELDLPPDVVPPRHFRLSTGGAGELSREEPEPAGQAEAPPFAAPDQRTGEAIASARKVSEADTVELQEWQDEDQTLADGYSSLLSLSRPARQQFIRIEEAQDDDGEVKPFVVFPSESPSAPVPFARPEDARDRQRVLQQAGDDSQRRFDPPTPPVTQPDGNRAARTGPDPKETERALRAALATLQRMSGAA